MPASRRLTLILIDSVLLTISAPSICNEWLDEEWFQSWNLGSRGGWVERLLSSLQCHMRFSLFLYLTLSLLLHCKSEKFTERSLNGEVKIFWSIDKKDWFFIKPAGTMIGWGMQPRFEDKDDWLRNATNWFEDEDDWLKNATNRVEDKDDLLRNATNRFADKFD